MKLITKKKVGLICGLVAVAAGGAVAFMWLRGPRGPRFDDPTSRPQLASVESGESNAQPLANSQDGESNVVLASSTSADLKSWSRFRGPNGTGISFDKTIPSQWSESNNLLWKTKLPGAGSSSPVLTDQYVFVTCYSGYGGDSKNAGTVSQLKRELVCIQRSDGKIVWSRSVDAVQPEDPYQGMGVPEHGYATNSVATDGKTVFAFFGKSGVVAFDLQGNQLWKHSVGTDSGNRRWGTAASLVLYDQMLIVNAAEEARAIIALDKTTGNEVWKADAKRLELSYGTPAIVNVDPSRDDLVIAVPSEIWGMNPRTGKLVWYAETSMTDNLSPSVIVDGKKIFAFGGYRSSGSLAIEAGGEGDVTKSKILWSSRNTSYVATPVLHEGRLHWIDDRGTYYCQDAATGELVHRERVQGLSGAGRPVYASPIVINGLVFIQTRSSGVFVIEPGNEFKVLSQNTFTSDESQFNATPAVDSGQLFLRSDRYLYCVSSSAKS